MSSTPIETKVVAATGGAAGGSVLSAFIVWLEGVLLWGAPNDAGHADDAILAVPAPVAAITALTVLAAATWVAGYLARHTPRDDTGALNGSIVVTLAAVLVAVCALIYILGHVDLHG